VTRRAALAPAAGPVAALVLAAALALAVAPAAAVAAPAPTADPPVYAYYYIWFNASSWNRAKQDYPLLGRYSSDERRVMRRQIRWARQAGIDGWIVSWKDTPTLTARLTALAAIARQEHFKLAVIYQGLDFGRRPLPTGQIGRDLDSFRARFAADPTFAFRGRPLVIWSGTWKFTRREVASVTATRRRDLTILATERNARAYEAKAGVVDGDAYYWSSANPDTYPDQAGKLRAMSAAVDDHHGLWVAPAAPGFDARGVGGRTVVPRKDGRTLRRELAAALSSRPDMVGVISWNEFSENSQVEPSTVHGDTALRVLADVLHAPGPSVGDFDSSAPAGGGSAADVLPAIGGVLGLLAGGVLLRRRHTRGRGQAGAPTASTGRTWP
jgi:hypothetical protein